jgi:hypothetical protein
VLTSIVYVDVAWTEGSTASGTERRRDGHSSLMGIVGDYRVRYSIESIDTIVHRSTHRCTVSPAVPEGGGG